jgi:cytochrome c oxidase assembly factor CtaG
MSLKKLTPRKEIEFLKEINGEDYSKLFGSVKESFALLQTRSQMLLGLATICLTITGFSGPRMAQSNAFSRFFIGFGLSFVLAAVIAVVAGPLRLQWMTAWKADTLDETLTENIRRRDSKTRLYRIATFLLLIGLTGYLLSLIFYLAVLE